MPLSDRDIALFARDCVAEDSLGAPNETRRQARLSEAQAHAWRYYEATQQAIRASGYRVTPRIKDRIWDELLRIQAAATEKDGTGGPTPARPHDGKGGPV